MDGALWPKICCSHVFRLLVHMVAERLPLNRIFYCWMNPLREWDRRRPSSRLSWLNPLNKSGITILFIDHDMEFVRGIAETVTVLHYGKPFAKGTLSEIEANEEVVRIYLGKV
jgi:ABC-type Mn2+/Zn2+ transport system ATPase subunit